MGASVTREDPSRYQALAYLEPAWGQGRTPSNHTSLGCYPLVAIHPDGGCSHPGCVHLLPQYEDRTGNRTEDQWRVVAVEVYWEGPPTECGECGAPIESAYGAEDDE